MKTIDKILRCGKKAVVVSLMAAPLYFGACASDEDNVIYTEPVVEEPIPIPSPEPIPNPTPPNPIPEPDPIPEPEPEPTPEPEPEPEPEDLNPPNTNFVCGFQNLMTRKIECTFSGTDIDDDIIGIIPIVNGIEYAMVNPGDVVEYDIIERVNTLEAIAVNDIGVEDPTPATFWFYSPNETEAREDIKGIEWVLDNPENPFNRGRTYTKDNFINGIQVDYLVEKINDQNKLGAIVYVNHQEDLAVQQANQIFLRNADITVLYMAGAPIPRLLSDGITYSIGLIEPQVHAFLDCLDRNRLYPC